MLSSTTKRAVNRNDLVVPQEPADLRFNKQSVERLDVRFARGTQDES